MHRRRSDRASPHGEQREHVFESETVTSNGHTQSLRLGFLLFLPRSYGSDAGHKWPLILYLHGIGERGTDLGLVKMHGIAKIVEQEPDFPFVAISPQCPDETVWPDHHDALNALIEEIVAAYAVDADRIYLTGNSMGGYGTWSLAASYPQRFAALAPICGGGEPEGVCALKEVPVWAFHGAEDPAVELQNGQEMVDALRACGGNVRFTVYPGVGHDSWTQTYDSPELYQWFLQHSR